MTSPAWTWSDLALTSSLLDALVLTDKVIRQGRIEYGERAEPLATREELQAVLALRGRANGVRTAAEALHRAQPGSDSPQETVLRFLCEERGLPQMRVNVWLDDENGRKVVQPDLSIREYKIAIQYDGEAYHSGEQMRRDVLRTERTEALGWIEVRITKDHMRHSGRAAVAKIERALRQRGWSR
ncbi:PDDEXK family nuclease [Nesterenkonia ebinurensis]|uniref:hypothetical protein n=1 Tax=Nesterenkonia ebinurensis TaxID=2608252 RepID=UPI00123DF565|nr:hypothetical protein [Nesterenkonia ebinurensis]